MNRASDYDPTLFALPTVREEKRIEKKIRANSKRRCAECGTLLSIYNKNDLCFPCQQKHSQQMLAGCRLANRLEPRTERTRRQAREAYFLQAARRPK